MQKSVHSPAYRAFRQFLREAREESGVTQVQLAERLAESQDFVSKCERGVRRLDVVELVQWCRALDVPFPEFAEDLERLVKRTLRRR